jgi:large subunit ribosomal protein L36
MKVAPSIKARCKNCRRIKRKGVNFIVCEVRRHKQRQG